MATINIHNPGGAYSALHYDLDRGKDKDAHERIAALPATEPEPLVPGFEPGARARIVCGNIGGRTASALAEKIERVARQRPEVENKIKTIVVSVVAKDGKPLSGDRLKALAQEAIKGLGYDESPFVVFEHRDKEHQHLHIVTSRVRFDGTLVKEWKERDRARDVARGIEQKYDLVETRFRAERKGLTIAEYATLRKQKKLVAAGKLDLEEIKLPAKMIAQASLDRACAGSCTFDEIISKAEKLDLLVAGKFKDGKLLGYSVRADNIWFKASHLGTKYTIKGIEKHYAIRYNDERDAVAFLRAGERAREREISESRSRSGIEAVAVAKQKVESASERIAHEAARQPATAAKVRPRDFAVAVQTTAAAPNDRAPTLGDSGIGNRSAAHNRRSSADERTRIATDRAEQRLEPTKFEARRRKSKAGNDAAIQGSGEPNNNRGDQTVNQRQRRIENAERAIESSSRTVNDQIGGSDSAGRVDPGAQSAPGGASAGNRTNGDGGAIRAGVRESESVDRILQRSLPERESAGRDRVRGNRTNQGNETTDRSRAQRTAGETGGETGITKFQDSGRVLRAGSGDRGVHSYNNDAVPVANDGRVSVADDSPPRTAANDHSQALLQQAAESSRRTAESLQATERQRTVHNVREAIERAARIKATVAAVNLAYGGGLSAQVQTNLQRQFESNANLQDDQQSLLTVGWREVGAATLKLVERAAVDSGQKTPQLPVNDEAREARLIRNTARHKAAEYATATGKELSRQGFEHLVGEQQLMVETGTNGANPETVREISRERGITVPPLITTRAEALAFTAFTTPPRENAAQVAAIEHERRQELKYDKQQHQQREHQNRSQTPGRSR